MKRMAPLLFVLVVVFLFVLAWENYDLWWRPDPAVVSPAVDVPVREVVIIDRRGGDDADDRPTTVMSSSTAVYYETPLLGGK